MLSEKKSALIRTYLQTISTQNTMQDSYSMTNTQQEIIDSYHTFLEKYTQKRDIDSVIQFFSPDITNIGSGEDELTLDYNEVVEIFKRDIRQCPCPLSYSEKQLSVNVLSPIHGLLISSFDSSTIINNMPYELKGYRFSMLWTKTQERWLISHIHLSRGETSLKPGESFPLTEIEEKNADLEKLVRKRTRELCQLNIEISEANKEINEIKQRFETIFEKASDGIMVGDWVENEIFMINQRMCDMLGYPREEAEKLWITNLLPAEDRDGCLQRMEEEASGRRTIADDIPLICKNKELKYFDITSQSIKIKKKNYRVSLYRDITEHKKTILLRQQAEIARKASESKNLFLANMSHEIRTPVTGIMGMTEILSKTQLDTQQSEYLRIIKDSSRILLTLINDILDISKIEAGKLVLKQQPFRIDELINKIKTLTHPGLLNNNNTVEVNVDPGLPQWISTDQIRLEQVLMNLLNNAIKFTQNGSIGIKAEKIKGENNNSLLKVSVSDTGIGISASDQEKLFQKYQQIDTSLSRPADGSGLGLYICRQLVSLMGGTIGVQSRPCQGSLFWFQIPYMEVQQVTEPMPEINGIDDTDVKLGLNVLLVDDKRVNLQVISLMLQTAQCKIDTAFNGIEALERFNPEKHEVVLMDIMMPQMDGITAMKELRKKHHHVPPIIAITANAMAGDKEKYIKEGFDAYITKPLTLEKLTEELLDLGLMERRNNDN